MISSYTLFISRKLQLKHKHSIDTTEYYFDVCIDFFLCFKAGRAY